MASPTLEMPSAGRQWKLGRVVAGLLLALIAAYMLSQGVEIARRTVSNVREGLSAKRPPFMPRLDDFSVFYTAGRLVREGKFGDLYDPPRIERAILRDRGINDPDKALQGNSLEPYYRYYNPPIWALLTAPLTFLPITDAFKIAGVINLVALLAIVLVIARIIGDRPVTFAFLTLGMFSFDPTYASFQAGQQSIIVSLAALLAYKAVLAGEARAAGSWLAALVIKGHYLPFNALGVLRIERRAWKSLLLVALVLLAPFLLVGFHGMADYLKITSTRSHQDITNLQLAIFVMSWPGFLATLHGATAAPVTVYLFDALTLVPFLVVLIRGDRLLLPAAAAIAGLLVIPHSHHQDWFLLIPASTFLVTRPTEPRLAVINYSLMFLVYVAVNDAAFTLARMERHGTAIYWATPAAFIFLVWLAILPLLEAKLGRLHPAGEAAGQGSVFAIDQPLVVKSSIL